MELEFVYLSWFFNQMLQAVNKTCQGGIGVLTNVVSRYSTLEVTKKNYSCLFHFFAECLPIPRGKNSTLTSIWHMVHEKKTLQLWWFDQLHR